MARLRHTRERESHLRFGGHDGVEFPEGEREVVVDDDLAEWAVKQFDDVEYADEAAESEADAASHGFTAEGDDTETGETDAVDAALERVEGRAESDADAPPPSDTEAEPPTESEAAAPDPGEFDPSEHTIAVLESTLPDVDVSTDELHARERAGKDRDGAHEAIDAYAGGETDADTETDTDVDVTETTEE